VAVTTREWTRVDYYETLGVARDASADEITTRFRELAKSLHPDAAPRGPGAIERFKRLTVAYKVLGDTRTRRDYDRVRRDHASGNGKPVPVPETVPARHERGLIRTRRGGWWAVVAGIGCLVLGLAAAGLVMALQRHDASLRHRGVKATATIVDVSGERQLEFTTADGHRVRASEPLRTGTGDAAVGSRIGIRYDRDHPTRVITNESKVARDITLWIVAIKLLVAGAAFIGFGVHRLHRLAADR
jgi:curved DNA-binding protein CbpA